jgi:hypothetical protein
MVDVQLHTAIITECCYAGSRNAKSRYAEIGWHFYCYGECLYADCHGAKRRYDLEFMSVNNIFI